MGGQDPLLRSELEAVRKKSQKRIGEQWLSECSATQPSQARQTISGLWWRLGHCARWVRLRDRRRAKKAHEGIRRALVGSKRTGSHRPQNCRKGSARAPERAHGFRLVKTPCAWYRAPMRYTVASRLVLVPCQTLSARIPCEGSHRSASAASLKQCWCRAGCSTKRVLTKM